MSIHDILSTIRAKAQTERQKGRDFERLMKLWFLTDPRYGELRRVWLWEEFPARGDLGAADLGIDLVALTSYGDYWAIQSKCYAEDAAIAKGDVDSFLANASRTFRDPKTQQVHEFSRLVWVQTSRKPWGPNAQEAIQGLAKPFNRISLHDLELSAVDWQKLRDGLYGSPATLPGKQPMAHQLEALSAAYEHYVVQGHERGKLIMACGTGKTFTALRIAERLTPKDGFVLFLVPSIALLGQTLNAWMADKSEALRAVCVCSDARATRQMREADAEDASVVDLAVPASTDTEKILRQLRQYHREACRTVIFSTYQSIDVVKQAVDAYGRELDIIICDEAHRTTGTVLKDREESHFTKVHRNDFLPARRRLYMTATPRLFSANVKVRASQDDNIDELCSMDDEATYGHEFHRLTFNDAVARGLLTDYKVLVLTVSEDDIPESIRTNIKRHYAAAGGGERLRELNFDDATKLIGCINGLSKRIKGDDGITRQQDPLPMRRAVAFCQTINPSQSNPTFASTQIARYFGLMSREYRATLPEDGYRDVVSVSARHIDGSMDAATRNELVAWLKQDADDPQECRVLCNVRCLSEGVDVPALDAVLFLSPRNSEVEVVQSVGRVMRSFRGKKYGYIIIPVIVPTDVSPEEALADNERFRVVWDILNALRSHDENFNAHVNKIHLNKKRPPKIVVAAVPRGSYTIGHDAPADRAVGLTEAEAARQLELQFGTLQGGIYARLVEKVGDKMYWEHWARSIGDIALKFTDRINLLISENDKARQYFADFLGGLHSNINDSIDQAQAVEMLAQHMITRPMFDALFSDYRFVRNNAVSRSMQDMLEVLEDEGLEMETQVLERFYQSVRNNVSGIDNLGGKQKIIYNLYEKFFRGAFPLTVEKLGIVYTPVECVDFIIRSVEHILRHEFGTSLTEDNVHILDPFTGTGTFITRLMQSGLIRPEDMLRKYRNEIHCNEIVLLAYYIADVNIEAVFHELMHPDHYVTYDGICLTDTFQLNEHGNRDIYSMLFEDNSERVIRQKRAPVRVIIGNPPYSVGQRSANDNAQNIRYQHLEQRIAQTYAKRSRANLVKSLYDSYIKAFRWASDRIAQMPQGGVVAFISNGAWIDGNGQDGMRACLQDEFTSIYVLNLRGNQRTSGELSRKEGGKIFGSGSRTPIAITFLVKNPARQQQKATIYYHDIGDYLTREQKLKIISDFSSIENIEWTEIQPNDKNDWINKRDGVFDEMIAMAPDKKFNTAAASFFCINAIGVSTNRDAWVYGFSKQMIGLNVSNLLSFYEEQREEYLDGRIEELSKDEYRISWTVNLKKYLMNNVSIIYSQEAITQCIYRPFCKMFVYYDRKLIERPGLWSSFFPQKDSSNLIICVSGSKNGLSALISDCIPDLHFNGDTQCFPLYWYEENKHCDTPSVFGDTDEKYIRRDGITDWILSEARSRYGTNSITKEMIFYYVYGLLHSEDYRRRFAADLRKSLPRLPLVERVEDFMSFSLAGKALAALHLRYEAVPPCPEVTVTDIGGDGAADAYAHYAIGQMRFARGLHGERHDKTRIIYNGFITIENIPLRAYDYVVNGKSAVEWVMERYCDKTDPRSRIRNDANDWSREHHQPRYILDLLLAVVSVSIKTADIVAGLPTLDFE
ncbi:MAG: DEAD/DEAH box helicase [Bacteroidaceae bacterium]|nr:DEAD/DEAH box helicase [Bacteroidaceae bacterium]